MQIRVTGGTGTVDGRTRGYLESRLFNTLRSVDRDISRIDVSLSYSSIDVSRAVRCTVVLNFRGGEQIVATAVADWPYAAIDGAVSKAWKHVRTRSREAVTA